MEQEILNIAIEKLSAISGLVIKATHPNELPNDVYDGDLTLSSEEFSFNMPFAVKRKVTMAQLPFLQDYLSTGGIVVFESASKETKEQLRNLGINYIDISGSAYVFYKGIRIFIDTGKKIKLEDKDSSTAFSKTGLKVIYQLLNNRDSINYTYRELGQVAAVSIDTVGRVYRELVRDKYLAKIDNKRYKIIDYDRLFKDWVTLFNKTLRPKLKKRSFRFEPDQRIQSLFKVSFDGKLGGELAAEQLSEYNIAEKATIYVKGSFVDLAKELGLRPDLDGPITMVEQFWNDSADDTTQNVGIPLLYADLVADPKPRNLQIAKAIYDEYAYQPVPLRKE